MKKEGWCVRVGLGGCERGLKYRYGRYRKKTFNWFPVVKFEELNNFYYFSKLDDFELSDLIPIPQSFKLTPMVATIHPNLLMPLMCPL